MDSVQQRRDEILAKKNKLAELKRQREFRQKELTASRQSVGESSGLVSPTPSRADNRKELDSLITSLVGDGSRPGSTAPGARDSLAASPRGLNRSRPTSVVSASRSGGERVSSGDHTEYTSSPLHAQAAATISTVSHATQTLSLTPVVTVHEAPSDPKPKPEYITYSKGVQTSEPWSPQRRKGSAAGSESEDEQWGSELRSPRASKRLSRREREREEELRHNIRKEIEDELKALQKPEDEGGAVPGATNSASGHKGHNFPARPLSDEELNAVTSSDAFLDFVERSSKVIERALDEEYDVLADYAMGSMDDLDEDEDGYGTATRGKKKGRRVRETLQFWDERWSKKRMVTDLNFATKFPELLLASYTKNPASPSAPPGLILVWNQHMPSRPEYTFHATSDILCAKFSPFHPNLILGGSYSGQVLLWDTRAKSAPVQKTPLTGNGHTHPVYSIDVVGTQNANNVISASTDGVVCGWSIDMLAQPIEFLELIAPPNTPGLGSGLKSEDVAPMCIGFPQSDPTYFLTGTEEGSILPCHRYDRAGAKAGVDQRIMYRGHSAPVTGLDFHPSRGPLDLGDLVLSSSMDWTVKLWRVRPPAAAAASSRDVFAGPTQMAPVWEFNREDLVYDVQWSPTRPGVFALVDGAGSLEVWDVNVDVEVPVAKLQPTDKKGDGIMRAKSLNRVAWEKTEGKKLAVGGLDGVVSIFEVGNDLGGVEGVRAEEWTGVKRWVGRLEIAMESAAGSVPAANGR